MLARCAALLDPVVAACLFAHVELNCCIDAPFHLHSDWLMIMEAAGGAGAWMCCSEALRGSIDPVISTVRLLSRMALPYPGDTTWLTSHRVSSASQEQA
jgi:hypothetical protein